MENGHDYRFTFFDDIDDIFDAVFGTFPKTNAADWALSAKSKLPNGLVSAAYPPANVFMDKDKNYRIQLACAGYEASNIEIEFEKDSLSVKLTGKSPFEVSPCMMQKGIKVKDDGSTISFFIDTRKFDVEKLSSSMRNGLLDISIPAVPTKKFTVGVGSVPEEKKSE